MGALLRIPQGFIRRNLSTLERVLVALGLSYALFRLLASFPAYPSPWEVVLVVTIFFVMLWSPGVAYFLAVITALYPLYTVSLYLVVLFLAVALLGHRLFINNLGALLLVIFTPWLAQFHLAWIVPLLGGLWWGKIGGAWIGALAALWSQLLFGMAGASPDLLAAVGTAPSIPTLIDRFGPAGSLETLLLLVSPLAPNPTLLLYHLLQITLWAMTAALTGGLAERLWVQQARSLRIVVVIFTGAILLFAGHLGLAAWLEQYAGDRLYQLAPQIVLELLAVTVLAVVLEVVRDFIEHPFPGGRPGPVRESTARKLIHRIEKLFRGTARPLAERSLIDIPLDQAGQTAAETGNYQPMQVPSDLRQRNKKKQKPDDIIKIELD
jgi:hypothetical protein